MTLCAVVSYVTPGTFPSTSVIVYSKTPVLSNVSSSKTAVGAFSVTAISVTAGIGAPSVRAASTNVNESALPQSENCFVASKWAFVPLNVLVMTSVCDPS